MAAVADSEIAADEAAVVLGVEVVEGHHVVEGAWAVAHPEEAEAADSVEGELKHVLILAFFYFDDFFVITTCSIHFNTFKDN